MTLRRRLDRGWVEKPMGIVVTRRRRTGEGLLAARKLEDLPGSGAKGDLDFGGLGVDDDDGDDVNGRDADIAVSIMEPNWLRESTGSFRVAEMGSTVGGLSNDLFAGGHQDSVPEVASASYHLAQVSCILVLQMQTCF